MNLHMKIVEKFVAVATGIWKSMNPNMPAQRHTASITFRERSKYE